MVTILDIAKAAGVGKSTVSRVVNGDPNVNINTKEKVKEVITALGYVPNISARSMRTKQTFSVGILFPDLTNPFFPEWCNTVNRVIEEFGYMSYICITDKQGDSELKKIDDLLARNIDGIIFSSYIKRQGTLDKLRSISQQVPVVCWDSFSIGENIPLVTYNGKEGTYNAVKYLLSQGRRRIAYIKGADGYDTTTLRYKGYLQAIEEFDLPSDVDLIYEGHFQLEDGYMAADYFSTLLDRPDAILAATDTMALGCMERLKSLGINVPEDIAVFGFDNISIAEKSSPSLSSINMPIREMAETIVSVLMAQINKETFEPTTILPCELVLRESA